MNSNPPPSTASAAHPGCGEETLRLIASLPAPAGLEDRVHKALRAAPQRGRLLGWPATLRADFSLQSNWMRAAAAAAIVFVVIGGGWGVLSRVEQGKGVVRPAALPAPEGFSGAGAIRTPQTLPGPQLTERKHAAAGEQGGRCARKQDAQPAKQATLPQKAASAQPAPSPQTP